jgi:hypothetical protein
LSVAVGSAESATAEASDEVVVEDVSSSDCVEKAALVSAVPGSLAAVVSELSAGEESLLADSISEADPIPPEVVYPGGFVRTRYRN